MSGRFRLESVIGRGRHASLWLAHDQDRRRRVAVKVAQRGMLQAEHHALTELQGKGAVALLGFDSLDDGRDALAMPVLERVDLVRGDVDAIGHLLHEMAEALAHVHALGWVHRDLKPSHWLRSDAGLVLCDFGCASRAGFAARAAMGQLVGTPRYAAPEQCQGAPARPSADVYAFGACAFEMLSGRPPFPGQTLTELFSQHLRAPVPKLPGEAAHWQPLVDAMLAKQPADRPTDGGALLREMRHRIGVTP